MWKIFSWLFQAFWVTPQSRRSQECHVVNFLLAFPGFSRLSRKPRNQGKGRMCQKSFQSEAPGFFAHKEKPGKRGNFLLIFPGCPGNPGIKEEPGCASNHSSQKLRAFLHIRKRLESEEIFFLGSPGFSRNSWKARGPGHSWLFRAFSRLFLMCKKVRKVRNFTPEFRGIPGTFLQGSAAVFITRNVSHFVRAILPDCGVLKVLRSMPEGVRLQNNSPAKNV